MNFQVLQVWGVALAGKDSPANGLYLPKVSLFLIS
jgi:hypothetical protein